MSDETTPEKKAAVKKAAPKKSAVKKTAPKGGGDQAVRSVIEAMTNEFKEERSSQQRQMATLVQEIRHGLMEVQEESNARDRQRDEEFKQLLASIERGFSTVEDSAIKRDTYSDRMIAKLSETDREYLESSSTP